MMRTAARIITAFAALVVAALTSCDRSLTTPSPTLPPLPPQTVTTRIELIAPSTLAPGESTQLRVMAHRSDGSTHDITSSASFHNTDRNALTITPNGVATGRQVGESLISASVASFYVSREVVVVPAGTFRLRGQVVEADSPSVGVGTARVEPGNGFSPVITDPWGYFRFYGIPGNARLRVSKSGYVTSDVTLALSDHLTERFPLALSAPRLDVSGTYHLSVELSARCTHFPETLRTRRYIANITQSGAALRGHVSGAAFASLGDIFSGWVEPTGLIIEFDNDPYFAGTGLVEVVDAQTYLVVGGVARLVPAGAGFDGPLDGWIQIYGNDLDRGGQPITSCHGGNRLTLTR
jgi:hypothetical protein